MRRVRTCFGCRHLVGEMADQDTMIYRCDQFPEHIQIGIANVRTCEYEEPEPATERCYRPKRNDE